ncbi:hypothetical protein JAAARDRAFT_352504 [Jaapia argillacea MUCL 33604]|uniref:Uncharacterized protein n=1 Tax=Jaapia argillacea MUCL 33604 TaxID=933084 RepID=A0A067PX17_9AGAM|nr:hypothetical protein JAAARDRAFT_352504 [Jaapia argillacea MUCL 33604]
MPPRSHAQYCLSDYKASAAAFRRGLELDPTNASLKSGLQNAESRIVPDEDEDELPPLSSEEPATSGPGAGAGLGAGLGGLGGMADMMRNMGMGSDDGGGAGGMPDLAGLMNNPMMMQMAQQMMQNGGMERLMSNPAVSNMVTFQALPTSDRFADTPLYPDEPYAIGWRYAVHVRIDVRSHIERFVSHPVQLFSVAQLRDPLGRKTWVQQAQVLAGDDSTIPVPWCLPRSEIL